MQKRPRHLLPTEAATALASTSGAADEAEAAIGIRVSNGRVVEANGNDFVMRGVNHPHAWYTDRTGSLSDIKAKDANTVRVVLSSGHHWPMTSTAEVSTIVRLCKRNRLICVLEVHDTTGYGEVSGAATLSEAADYWIKVRGALQGQEQYVVINIGNEPHGNKDYERWTSDTSAAIRKLRGAGFRHAIMVDAPNWGQDYSGTMRNHAHTVFDADPNRNTIFSIHMYGVYENAETVRDYLDFFVSAGLPILIGEFGDWHTDGNPNEDSIMATAEELSLGYLGWSWSGNTGGYLDMVDNFRANSLTDWGKRIFSGTDGIASTAKEATIYASGGSSGGNGGTAPERLPLRVNGVPTDPHTDGPDWGNQRFSVVSGPPGGVGSEHLYSVPVTWRNRPCGLSSHLGTLLNDNQIGVTMMDELTFVTRSTLVMKDPGMYGIESVLIKKHVFNASNPILRGALLYDAESGQNYFVTDDDLARYEQSPPE